MNQDIIHVYFMPGLAASSTIFEYIKLPESDFKIHLLEWQIPEENETLTNYALRMVNQITEKNVALIGVSFGGVLVQEMSKHLKIKRLIIISSIKSKKEMPKRMKIMRATKAFKLFPASLMGNMDVLAKYAFGETVKKRVALYKKYLSVTDPRYINWAVKEMICWNQNKAPENIIHIHGSLDNVFPYRHIKNCITIDKGTHIMILNKYRWFNEHLPELILEGSSESC
ncbi:MULTISPECIES: YqiA/YcfP family alpha/beta fold hydrolase [Bizionia]|uniref:YqiA/YcfP family alpha/beta fold hydrolase n=1 Tax=Bizionia hallyeonensis TaxID=1123757 RepID=A0ABW0C6X9_9FLAO|nr:YqiA/YcfP family alpha/beta fold hydrolase [Bizionia sp. M204]UPS91480.1 alpha/beta hydrolase [Bizionia sp. M204]